MKKIEMFVLLATLLVLATGCGTTKEVPTTYTSKSGNFSIELPGDNFKEKKENEEEDSLNLNNGKYAFGVTQISKDEAITKNYFSFEEYSEDAKEGILKSLSLTTAAEEKITAPGMLSAKAWKLDLSETLKTQSLLVFGETEEAYYCYIAEGTVKNYDLDKYSAILGTLKEIKVTPMPEEEMKTYTSEGGAFTIAMSGEWVEEESPMGVYLTRDYAAFNVERVKKEETNVASLDELIELFRQSEEITALTAISTVTEAEFDKGDYKAAKTFLHEYRDEENMQMKQLFVYLETEDSYLSCVFACPAGIYDRISGRYLPAIHTLKAL